MQIHEGFGNITTCWQVRKKRLKLKKVENRDRINLKGKQSNTVHERSSIT